MKKKLAAIALSAAIMCAPGGSSHAASVDVDIDITLPSILILYCYDDIALSLSTADLATALGVTNDSGASVNGVGGPTGYTAAPGTVTADMDLTGSAPGVTTTIDLVLTDTCGVRAIASGGTATITVPSFEPTLEAAGGVANGSITVNSVTTSDAGLNGLTLTGGFGTLNTFDVTMNLDLSGVVAADTFSDTDGSTIEFVIEVVTP